MNAFRQPVYVYLSGLLVASRYMKQSTVAGTLCIARHPTEASQVAFLCNKEVGLSVSAKWWTTDVQVQPGARNQAVDETRIMFITLHEHCLGTGTRSALSVFH